MRISVHPGVRVGGEATVPGDKSIAHRWLILATTARGKSVLHDLPVGVDVRSIARCLARLSPSAQLSLERWGSRASQAPETDRFTWDGLGLGRRRSEVRVEAEGRSRLREPSSPLDCGNSGTTMRLLCGVLAAAPFPAVLTGDQSLRSRPMERVAVPLREMGAGVRTVEGHAPVEIEGGRLHGIRHVSSVPSAQVKGAVLLAGVAASGETTVVESAATRDHTERALLHLGAPVRIGQGRISVSSFQHGGFEASVPGDVSSAAFLAAAAALTGAELVVRGVGLNPSRTRYLEVMRRMGVESEFRIAGEELGEPVGDLLIGPCAGLTGTTVEERELPLVVDEVPVLAALAAHARDETRFLGAGELRVKESDRLTGIAEAIRSLGGRADVDGDDMIVAGGGLTGGRVSSRGDHRMAMAAGVAALAASGDSVIEGMEAADVSFPGFVGTLRSLGAGLEG